MLNYKPESLSVIDFESLIADVVGPFLSSSELVSPTFCTRLRF